MSEMTEGQRIAAVYAINEDECAAAIDEALATARRDAGLQTLREAHDDLDEIGAPKESDDPEYLGSPAFLEERIKMAVAAARQAGYMEGCVVERDVVNENKALRDQLTAKDAALKNITGDNLCWVTDPEQAKALPVAEFLESCRRYRQQIADERGEFTGGRTIAQLEEALAAKDAECAAMRSALEKRICLCPRLTEFQCSKCKTPAEERGDQWGGFYYWCPTCDDSVSAPIDESAPKCERCAALASHAGAEMLARLRAAEESASFGRDAVQGLSEDLRAAEEKAAALQKAIRHCSYCTCALAAIQAARAKEPLPKQPVNDPELHELYNVWKER